MNKQRKPSKHPGGRPPIYADRMIKVTIYVPKYQYDHILKIASDGRDFAQAVRIIVEKDIDNANSN